MGPDPRDRPPERPVRARGDPLRDDRRPTSVPGGDSTRDAGAGPEPGAGPAHEAPAQDADGPRDDLPEGPPEGPRQALPRRRGDGRGPPPLPRRRADRRPPRGRPGAALAVVPAQPPRRRPGRGGRADGDRDHGRLGGVRRVPEDAQRRTRRVLQEGEHGEGGRADERAGGDRGEERRDRRQERRGRRPQEGATGPREGRGAGPGGVRPEPQRPGGATRPQRPAQSEAPLDPGDAGPPRGADQHDADRTRGHDRLPGAARHGGPRQGRIRAGHPDARRDQPASRPDRDGIRQVRRDRPLLPPDGGALRATGRGRPRRARTAEGQGQRQGDARRLPDGPDRRRRGRPEVLRPGARPSSSVAGPGAVQRRGEARRREHPRCASPAPA